MKIALLVLLLGLIVAMLAPRYTTLRYTAWVAVGMSLTLAALDAMSQTVYRQGNTYSDVPVGEKVYIVDNVVQAVRPLPQIVVAPAWVPPERPRIPQRHLTPVQLNITVTQEPRYDPLNSPATGYGRWPCTRPGCYDAPRHHGGVHAPSPADRR